jgi:anti-sigma B factor antagonist
MTSEQVKVTSVKTHSAQAITVVELNLPDGLDSTVFDRLNEDLQGVFDPQAGNNSNRWVLDLSNVSYLGSAALGFMVNIRHRVRTHNGKLALCNLSPRLYQIFKTCCLEKLFTITRSRDEALRAVR